MFPLKRSSRLLQRITGRAGTVLAAVHPVHEAVGAAVVPPLRRALFLPAGEPHEKRRGRGVPPLLFAFVLVPFVVRYEKRLPKAQRAPKEAMGKAGKKQKASAHGKPEGPA